MPNITAHNISLVYDSISDLLQADDGFLKPGMVVQTLGYYSRGDCPPGIFYVESQLNQNDGVDGGTLDLVDEFRLQTEAFHDREIGHETCVILVEGTDLTALELAACTGDTGDDTYLLCGSAERDERESDDEE